MGKITILQSLGAGYYKIKVHFDNSRVAARLSLFEKELPKLEERLTDISERKTEQQALVDQALQALNQYVTITPVQEYVQDPSTLNKLTAAAYVERGKMDTIVREERLVKLQKREMEQERKKLTTQCPDDFETYAWCVANNENLTGELESIECDYLLQRDIHTDQIKNDTGIWLPGTASAPESSLQHALASSAWASWFNLCVAPATQRHKARYRVAVIDGLDKDDDTCNLTFQGRYDVGKDPSKLIDDNSIHPQFYEAQQVHYAGAAIVYPPCNGKAFEDGDKVIVDLHGGVGTPTVIGFYENPRKCQGPWTFITLLGFNTNGVPGGLGIPLGASGQGPISVYSYTVLVEGFDWETVPGSLMQSTTVDEIETNAEFQRMYTTAALGVSIKIVQTFTRTLTAHKKQNMYYPSTFEYEEYEVLLEESITSDMTIGDVHYGDIYSYSGTTTITGSPGIEGTSHREFTATAKQLAIYQDGSVKATRNYSATGTQHEGVSSITYSRITTGDLDDITDEDIINAETSTWNPGFLAYMQPEPFPTPGPNNVDIMLNSNAW